MISMDTVWNFLSISERASVRDRVIISAAFMMVIGQVEVMKIRAGFPFTLQTDWVTWSLLVLFFVALWGRMEPGVSGVIRYVVSYFVWSAISDTIRVASVYLMTVILFPGPASQVVP